MAWQLGYVRFGERYVQAGLLIQNGIAFPIFFYRIVKCREQCGHVTHFRLLGKRTLRPGQPQVPPRLDGFIQNLPDNAAAPYHLLVWRITFKGSGSLIKYYDTFPMWAAP